MLHRHNLMGIMLIGLSLLATACSATTADRATNVAPSQATPAPITAAATATKTPPTPSVIPPTSTVPPTAVPLPSDQDLAQLKALIIKQLPTAPSASPDQSIETSILPLTTTGKLGPLYAVYTTGSIFGFNPDARHLLALYTFANSRWNEVQTVKLENADYVDSTSVRQVMFEPSHVWLEVQSGAGAHSGCYDLFAFEPISRSIAQQISTCNTSPDAGHTADVNGDGQLDVVIDQTDNYVFCYACGVSYFRFQVMNWDGAHLTEQTLRPIPDTAPPATRENGNRAVQLAQAGLWKDALAAADAGKLSSSSDPVTRWDGALIQLHADAFKEQATTVPTSTLLPNLFYGDYDAVIDVLRPYPPADLFKRDTPLIKGTVLEDWEDALSSWITTTTTSAITAQPDLAAAYFLRGWGEYLANAKDPAALQDVEKAAQLEPNDPLYTQSVVYLKQ